MKNFLLQIFTWWNGQTLGTRFFTGTPGAYRPQGSLASTGERPRVTGDYDAWTPGA